MKLTIRILCILTILVQSAISTLYAQTVAADDICIAINSKQYLYVGFDNPVKLAVAGVPYRELRFECKHAKIKTGAVITINPDTLGIITLNAYRGAQLVANFRFRAMQVVRPVAGLNGKRSGRITKAELTQIGQLELFADPDNSLATASQLPYNTLFRITSFTLSSGTKEGFNLDRRSNSNKFSSEMIQVIQYLRPGQKIYFEEIRAESVDGKEFDLGTISFKIQ